MNPLGKTQEELVKELQKLRESEERYKKSQEISHVGSWVLDIKNNTFWGSDEGKRIYGFNMDTDIFTAEEVMKCVVERDRVDQAMVDLIEKNEPYNIVFDIIPRNSSEKRTIHSVAELVREKNGNPLIVTGVLRDITDRKLAEDEIKRKNEELQLVNAEKDKFFSIIAHDLKSPFNSFLGFTKMLEEDLPTMTLEQIQKIADSMRKSAINLYNLLENLLEWSLMQRGITTFDPASFLLMPKISESIGSILQSAAKKEIEISYYIHDELVVFADEKMLGSILRNLSSNAVKFTPRGGKVTFTAKPSSNRSVEISVQDTGIGMNQEMVENLFKLDIDTSRKGTENERSTGLGLIICKEFIEKHGGKLWVESEEGKGSTFYFTLPNDEG